MGGSCPDCGADVEFSEREVRLVSGTCPDCGKTSIVIGGEGAGTVDLPAGATPGAEGAEDAAASGAECPKCGEGLAFESITEESIRAVCTGCETRFEYSSGGGAERERPRRFGGEERDDRRGGGFQRPGARPCRECGGPLRFTTGPDGNTVGECASCGNRFTLPPRRDGPRGGRPSYGGRRNYGGGGDRRRGGWSSGGDGERPARSGPRRYVRRSDDDDEESTRRRRPRRE